MNDLLRRLRRAVLSLSSWRPARAVLRQAYSLHLRLLALRLAREPLLEAILLRRPAVLRDAHPGESDLDVTLVIRDDAAPADVASFARAVRQARASLPLLGEVWVVPTARWPAHARFHATDYHPDAACPGGGVLVWRRSGRPFVPSLPALVTGAEIMKRRRDLLVRGVAQLPLWFDDDPRLASRRCMKIEVKARALELAAAGRPAAVEYAGFRPLRREELETESARLVARLVHHDVPADAGRIALRIEGDLAPPDARTIEQARACVRAGGPSPSATLLAIRPFASQFALRLENATPTQSLAVSRRIRVSDTNLSPAYAIGVTAAAWDWYLRQDPIGALCSELWSCDLPSGRETVGRVRTFDVDRSVLELELVECLDMIDSSLRGTATHYLLDVCMAARCYLSALTTGVLPVDRRRIVDARPFPLRDLLPAAAIDRYREADLRGVDAFALVDQWSRLRPLIRWLNSEAMAALGPSAGPGGTESRPAPQASS